MKKQNICTIVLAVFTAVFLAGGLWFMIVHQNTVADYETAIQNAQQTLTGLDIAVAEDAEAALAVRLKENQTLEAEIAALQEKNDALDTAVSQLQGSNAALQQQEDIIYYQTILESLREGMNKLGQHLDN